jgi:hypothetical protein
MVEVFIMVDGRRKLSVYFIVILLVAMAGVSLRGASEDAGLVAEAGGPYESSECQSVLLDASGSGGAELYRWNVEGMWSSWSDFPYLEYTWLDEFDGTVVLEVMAGNLTVNDTASVVIGNLPPGIVSYVGPDGGVPAGQPVQVTVAFFDGDAREQLSSLDSFVVVFSWGDGSSSQMSLPAGSSQAVGSHRYASAGLYEVGVTVSDDDGGNASGSLQVNVSAPLFSFAGLLEYLRGLGLPKGALNSLEVKLSAALAAFNAGQYQAAVGKLGAFLNEVRAQWGKKIPAGAGNELLRLAAGLLKRFPK